MSTRVPAQVRGPSAPDPRPQRWPVAVAERIRAILEISRHRISLEPEDCVYIAHYFLFPNLVRWVLKMQDRAEAQTYQGCCPVFEDQPDCRAAPITTTNSVPADHFEDLCRCRETEHPWAHQVTLIFNNLPGWRCNVRVAREHPSPRCAREMWKKIVDNQRVQNRWKRCRFNHRETRLGSTLGKIADWLERVAVRSTDPAVDLVQAMCEVVDLGYLVEYCLRANQMVEQWTDAQRDLGVATRDQVCRKLGAAITALIPPMCYHHRLRWTFPTDRYRSDVDAFRRALLETDIDRNQEIADMLAKPELDVTEQLALLRYIANQVRRWRNEGLPPGDPLDDPVVQDIFWHRVGSAAETTGPDGPDSPPWRCFSVHDWAWKCWTAVGDPQFPVPCWWSRP